MEDLIHSPENSIFGENTLDSHLGLGRTATQELVLQQVKINFKSKTLFADRSQSCSLSQSQL